MIGVKSGVIVFSGSSVLGSPINIAELSLDCCYRKTAIAGRLGLTSRELEDQFRERLSLSLTYWLRRERMMQAQKLIRRGDSLNQIACELGYQSYLEFREAFKAYYSISPAKYRARVSVYCSRRVAEPLAYS